MFRLFNKRSIKLITIFLAIIVASVGALGVIAYFVPAEGGGTDAGTKTNVEKGAENNVID